MSILIKGEDEMFYQRSSHRKIYFLMNHSTFKEYKKSLFKLLLILVILNSGCSINSKKNINSTTVAPTLNTENSTNSLPIPEINGQKVLELESNSFNSINSWNASGVSSGAFMAVQLGIVHSKKFKKIGVFSGGPYFCSLGSATQALSVCMKNPKKTDFQTMDKELKKYENGYLIDSLYHLQKSFFYIVHGKKDPVILSESATNLSSQLGKYKTPHKLEFIENLGHGLSQKNVGSECDKTQIPWVNNCMESSIEKFFSLTSMEKQKSPSTEGQWYYLSNNSQYTHLNWFSKYTYVFVPQRCETQQCSAHLALHGCLQSPEFVKNDFYTQSGYIEASKVHNVIMIFPDIKKSKENPNGCWDWYGYTDKFFATNKAQQIQFLNNVTEKIQNKNFK